ncbi:hypothetical protein LUZ62_074838 [Rhynchospora pubera]|uniref:Uncharacterized protein n=1 Tax=Rhynchospora pubera TaxID=906938 RepID=A0AAV8DCR7_9POAL|nr:hypothetical protein LUZ62_074838 [Rhynchospora pubera]
MARRSTKLTNRAWRLLRLAVLWARKGNMFKQNRVLLQLRLLKTLKLKHSRQSPRLQCGDKQFSFDETPAFKFKTPSLRFLPCITPSVDHDFDADEVDFLFYRPGKEHDQIEYNEREQECVEFIEEGDRLEEKEGIDAKAEEFITRFYEEMRLQRQISAIQYYEMLERST